MLFLLQFIFIPSESRKDEFILSQAVNLGVLGLSLFQGHVLFSDANSQVLVLHCQERMEMKVVIELTTKDNYLLVRDHSGIK